MATKNLPNIKQGDDYSIRIHFLDGADISGFRFNFTVKLSYDKADAESEIYHTHIAGHGIADDAKNGICFLTIPSAITKAMNKGSYFYDLQVVSTSGEVLTILPRVDDYRHKIAVKPQITRAG